jgi:hypothetical protein
MIHWKKKNFALPPEKLKTGNCAKQIEKAIKDKNGDKYTTTYYQDSTVLNSLRAYSINKDEYDPNTDEAKCFYCESFTETVATLQVEHYRPKAKICDENNKLIPDTNGYYWLGCEWSNLLLACPHCNGSGAKGNKFPIRGTRKLKGNPIRNSNGNIVYTRQGCYVDRSPLADEEPLLLNPEVDEIVDKFTFSSDGEINGVGEKGEMSVEVYTLDRNQLNIARKKIKDSLIKAINIIITLNSKDIIKDADLVQSFVEPCKEIVDSNNPTKPYTLWAKYFNEHFEEYFVSAVPNKYKLPLKKAYKIVKGDD